MKKIISEIVMSILLAGMTHANFLYEEIDPVCSISGETYTSSAAGWSDTSAWHMIVAYSEQCDDTPQLSQSEKDKIYTIVDDFFTEKDYYLEMYNLRKSLNADGQRFINNTFFPAIKILINVERTKMNTDTKRIAILNYVATIVKYDYFISQ